jgi:hypothetical protein
MTEGTAHEPEPDAEPLADLELTPAAAEDVRGGADAYRGRYQVRLDESRKLLG